MKRPVIFCVLQSGSRSNGGVQSLSEIVRRLQRHRAIVLTNLESSFTKECRDHQIDVHIVPARVTSTFGSAPFDYIRTLFRYFGAVRRLLRDTGARVIHANDPLAFQLCLAAGKSAGAALVLNLRGTVPPGRPLPRRKYRIFFAMADRVLYLSNDMARRWRDVASTATRACAVTYSVADPQRFFPQPMNTNPPPVVLVPGVVRPLKGQLEFIRLAVPTLAESGAEIWFAGDFEPDRDAYAKACSAAAEPYSKSVRFLGHRDDMPELFARARVVAVPSRHEGLVRAMVEGMRCARPIVSFDVCSAREMLEEQAPGAGLVVERGDYQGMASALLHYCSDADAAAEAGRIGEAAAKRLFGPEEVVERYEETYDSLERNLA
jgi:glycosyltransferase involved in cell wall biosynthesis